MIPEIFADGVGRIDFAGGVVRIELVSLDPAAQGPERNEVRQRIVMPLEGYLQAINTMGDLVNKLVEAGLLKRNESASGPTG